MNDPKHRVRRRPGQRDEVRRGLLITLAFFLLLVAANVLKLFDTSVLRHREISELAASQHMRRSVTYPMRGNIVDSQGKILVTTTYVYTIGITPADVRSRSEKLTKEEITEHVSTLLNLDIMDVAANMNKVDLPYIQLKKNVDRETKEKLDDYLSEYSIGGFAIDPVMQRYYPEKNFASGVIGFTNRIEDNIQGIMGLERSYDRELTGQAGYRYAEVDNYLGTRLPNTEAIEVPAIDGHHLKININSKIQNVAQEVVDALAIGFDAKKGAFAIVLDAKTGAVWAMADSSSFDLNNPAGPPRGIHPDDWNPAENQDDIDYLTSNVWVNRSTMFPYEPGSSFKPLTAAIGLDEGKVDLEEYFSDEPMWVGDWTEYPISCWSQEFDWNHVAINLEQAMMYSCNPPFVQIAMRVGINKFYDYIKLMGMHERTGIDLPAESVGLVHSNPNIVDMATLAFGEQSTITGIRQAQLYAALGNEGKLMTPRIADALLDNDGNVVRQFKPEVQRRIFSAESTRLTLERMVVGTHASGVAPYVYFPGHAAAGKTGTSLAPYGTDENASSFSVGAIVPYDDPKFVVLTSLQVPRDNENSQALQQGNRYITRKVMEEMKFEPHWIEYDWVHAWDKEMIPSYNYNYTFFDALKDLTRHRGVQVRFPKGIRGDDLVTQMWPPGGSVLNADGFVFLGTENHPLPASLTAPTLVPDFQGLGLFEMRKLADEAQLNVNYAGFNPSGQVVHQSVSPGSEISKWSVISLTFSDETPADREIIEYQKREDLASVEDLPMTQPLPGGAPTFTPENVADTDSEEVPQVPEETVPFNPDALPDYSQESTEGMIPAGGHNPGTPADPNEEAGG